VLAYSPDGKTLASAGIDGTIRFWETTSGKEQRVIHAHKGEVRSLAYSPDGKLLASAGTDGVLQLWEAKSGRAVQTLRRGKHWINAVAFSGDGKLLAAGDDSPQLRIWDHSSKSEPRVIDIGHSVQGVVFTRDGKYLCVGGSEGEGVELWSVADARKVRKFAAWPNSFSPTSDGSAVLVADHDHPLALYSLDSGERLRFLKDQDAEVRPRLAVASASATGPSLAVGCADGYVRVFSAETARQVWSAQGRQGSIRAITFSPDGRSVASAGAEGSILIWDATTSDLRFPARSHSTAIISIGLSPDGKTVASVSRDGSLRTWQADRGKGISVLPNSPSDSSSVTYSPDGKLLVIGRRMGDIELRDAITGKLLRTLKGHQGTVTSLGFTRDGKQLGSGGWDRTIRLWDVATGEARANLSGLGTGRISSLAVSSDGRTLLLADGSVAPRLMDKAGKVLAEFEGPDGGCLAVALSPDGHVAASGGRDNMVRLWEVVSSQQRRALGGGGGFVHSLSWSVDGRFLASGHADGRVRLWDARSGLRLRELGAVDSHRGPVLALSFSADGKRLVSGSADTTGIVWDLSSIGPTPRPEPLKLSGDRLSGLWENLASIDAATAGEALQTLARAAEQSVALLGEKILPVREETVRKLLKDLDSPRFSVRDRASLDLIALGRFIEPVLRAELRNKPTLEMRRRIVEILKIISAEERSPDELRALRGLELLEMIGTADAKKLLQELAAGAPLCDLTREAKAVLQRLSSRSKDMP
jgi:WD40 repeat protein